MTTNTKNLAINLDIEYVTYLDLSQSKSLIISKDCVTYENKVTYINPITFEIETKERSYDEILQTFVNKGVFQLDGTLLGLPIYQARCINFNYKEETMFDYIILTLVEILI